MGAWAIAGVVASIAAMAGSAVSTAVVSTNSKNSAISNAEFTERKSEREKDISLKKAQTEEKKIEMQVVYAERLSKAKEDLTAVRNSARVWDTQRRLDRELDRAADLRGRYPNGSPFVS